MKKSPKNKRYAVTVKNGKFIKGIEVIMSAKSTIKSVKDAVKRNGQEPLFVHFEGWTTKATK